MTAAYVILVLVDAGVTPDYTLDRCRRDAPHPAAHLWPTYSLGCHSKSGRHPDRHPHLGPAAADTGCLLPSADHSPNTVACPSLKTTPTTLQTANIRSNLISISIRAENSIFYFRRTIMNYCVVCPCGYSPRLLADAQSVMDGEVTWRPRAAINWHGPSSSIAVADVCNTPQQWLHTLTSHARAGAATRDTNCFQFLETGSRLLPRWFVITHIGNINPYILCLLLTISHILMRYRHLQRTILVNEQEVLSLVADTFLDHSSASEMTYIVSGGALNSTHSFTVNK